MVAPCEADQNAAFRFGNHGAARPRRGGLGVKPSVDVHCTGMKSFKVAEARARFGDLLDQAEQGTPVVIERKGVRFMLQAQRMPTQAVRPDRLFEGVDSAVLNGEWTWVLGSGGLRFRARRARR